MIQRILYSSGRAKLGWDVWSEEEPDWGRDLRTPNEVGLTFTREAFLVSTPYRGRQWISPNQVLFDNPRMCYTRERGIGAHVRSDWIIYPRGFVTKCVGADEPGADGDGGWPFRIIEAMADPLTFQLQRHLFRYLVSSTEPDPEFVDVCAETILRRSVERSLRHARAEHGPRKVGTRRTHGRSVERAKQFIAYRLGERLGMATVARFAGFAPAYFSDLFRREVGVTFHRYVVDLRLKRAFDALPDRAGDLSALALEMGFSSASHFSTAFRARFGATPSEAQSLLRLGRAEEALERCHLEQHTVRAMEVA